MEEPTTPAPPATVPSVSFVSATVSATTEELLRGSRTHLRPHTLNILRLVADACERFARPCSAEGGEPIDVAASDCLYLAGTWKPRFSVAVRGATAREALFDAPPQVIAAIKVATTAVSTCAEIRACDAVATVAAAVVRVCVGNETTALAAALAQYAQVRFEKVSGFTTMDDVDIARDIARSLELSRPRGQPFSPMYIGAKRAEIAVPMRCKWRAAAFVGTIDALLDVDAAGADDAATIAHACALEFATDYADLVGACCGYERPEFVLTILSAVACCCALVRKFPSSPIGAATREAAVVFAGCVADRFAWGAFGDGWENGVKAKTSSSTEQALHTFSVVTCAINLMTECMSLGELDCGLFAAHAALRGMEASADLSERIRCGHPTKSVLRRERALRAMLSELVCTAIETIEKVTCRKVDAGAPDIVAAWIACVQTRAFALGEGWIEQMAELGVPEKIPLDMERVRFAERWKVLRTNEVFGPWLGTTAEAAAATAVPRPAWIGFATACQYPLPSPRAYLSLDIGEGITFATLVGANAAARELARATEPNLRSEAELMWMARMKLDASSAADDGLVQRVARTLALACAKWAAVVTRESVLILEEPHSDQGDTSSSSSEDEDDDAVAGGSDNRMHGATAHWNWLDVRKTGTTRGGSNSTDVILWAPTQAAIKCAIVATKAADSQQFELGFVAALLLGNNTGYGPSTGPFGAVALALNEQALPYACQMAAEWLLAECGWDAIVEAMRIDARTGAALLNALVQSERRVRPPPPVVEPAAAAAPFQQPSSSVIGAFVTRLAASAAAAATFGWGAQAEDDDEAAAAADNMEYGMPLRLVVAKPPRTLRDIGNTTRSGRDTSVFLPMFRSAEKMYDIARPATTTNCPYPHVVPCNRKGGRRVATLVSAAASVFEEFCDNTKLTQTSFGGASPVKVCARLAMAATKMRFRGDATDCSELERAARDTVAITGGSSVARAMIISMLASGHIATKTPMLHRLGCFVPEKRSMTVPFTSNAEVRFFVQTMRTLLLGEWLIKDEPTRPAYHVPMITDETDCAELCECLVDAMHYESDDVTIEAVHDILLTYAQKRQFASAENRASVESCRLTAASARLGIRAIECGHTGDRVDDLIAAVTDVGEIATHLAEDTSGISEATRTAIPAVITACTAIGATCETAAYLAYVATVQPNKRIVPHQVHVRRSIERGSDLTKMEAGEAAGTPTVTVAEEDAATLAIHRELERILPALITFASLDALGHGNVQITEAIDAAAAACQMWFPPAMVPWPVAGTVRMELRKTYNYIEKKLQGLLCSLAMAVLKRCNAESTQLKQVSEFIDVQLRNGS